MSNNPSSSTMGTNVTDATDDMSALKDDPVLQGHSALNDPDLSGSTAATWTGTGGPDPGGMAGPAELDSQGNTDNTSAAGNQLTQMASNAGGQAQQAVGQAAGQAQQVAGQVIDTAKAQTTSRLSEGKDQLAATVDAVAEALRQSSQGLRDGDQAAIAGYAEQAAERLDGAASYLRDRDIPQLVDELEGVARRQPAVFLGAAFGLGLLAARFLKSSRQQAQANAAGSYGSSTAGSYSSNVSRSTDWTATPDGASTGAASTSPGWTGTDPMASTGSTVFRTEAPLPGSGDHAGDAMAQDSGRAVTDR